MGLYALRHGQSRFNVSALCNDDPAMDVGLTAVGREQAEVAARALAAIPLRRIFSSALPRALETARIVNLRRHLPMEIRMELNDIRSGFEGRPVRDYYTATRGDRLRTRVNGGESLLDYKQRVLGLVTSLPSGELDAALIVAHEETLRVLYGHFRQLPDEEMQYLSFGNCEILELA